MFGKQRGMPKQKLDHRGSLLLGACFLRSFQAMLTEDNSPFLFDLWVKKQEVGEEVRQDNTAAPRPMLGLCIFYFHPARLPRAKHWLWRVSSPTLSYSPQALQATGRASGLLLPKQPQQKPHTFLTALGNLLCQKCRFLLLSGKQKKGKGCDEEWLRMNFLSAEVAEGLCFTALSHWDAGVLCRSHMLCNSRLCSAFLGCNGNF